MGAALALKPSARALPEAAAALPASAGVQAIGDVGAPAVVNTSSKADKLSMAPSADAVEKVPVQTVKIAPAEVDTQAQPKSAPKAQEVVSWHWHVGSKITKRRSP